MTLDHVTIPQITYGGVLWLLVVSRGMVHGFGSVVRGCGVNRWQMVHGSFIGQSHRGHTRYEDHLKQKNPLI